MATAKVDNKRRITLKEARPGEVYDVEYIGGGHYKLARMRAEPAPKQPATDSQDLAPDEENED